MIEPGDVMINDTGGVSCVIAVWGVEVFDELMMFDTHKKI